ncbi:MAG: orotate phosphoribosyltransferase, partial [Bacteroidales bacterium]|nr:orotate phosphoribosyltransferase [Bacteroidales bacterium]
LEVAQKAFENADVKLSTITDYHTLIELAAEENFIRAEDLESLSQWRKNPEEWSDKRMNG